MNNQEFTMLMEKLTVVYIEDDLEIRKYISEFLGRYCKNLFEAGSAEEGLELYKKHKPDIVLVDINLPKMSGLDLVELIRENDKQTRIIISTAYTDQDFILKAVELNLTRYLVKPITSTDIIEVFKKALNELEGFDTELSLIDLGEGFVYDMKKLILNKDDEEIHLRKKERLLLEYFINNMDKVVTYDDIERKVWQSDSMSSDAIRSQIRNLRNKTYTDILDNISGTGYKLRSK